MKILFFYHSLVSDWNHGNAHFLRGIVSELVERGHQVAVYEHAQNWSLTNLRAEQGDNVLKEFTKIYPALSPNFYETLNLRKILSDADLVLVHEWNDPELVARIGRERKQSRNFRLLFHDTHHRAVTARAQMRKYDLKQYDGVLAYGRILADYYRKAGWTRRAWTWHEAADIRVFHPANGWTKSDDLVWVGNWGDDERAVELREFLVEPVKAMGLRAGVYGVRYPADALNALNAAGIKYRGWIANFKVPKVFAQARVTVHVPRRPYVDTLPGIPTIRPFEALACGIPLICSYWHDAEYLFTPGKDYLVAHNGAEMKRHLQALLESEALAADLASHGLATILRRHTCSHRVDQLLEIYEQTSL
jgi:spore maturation protein CgeB